MSKSKNNYPDPWLVIEKYGIDAVRFYLLTSPVMNGDDFNFSEKGVSEIGKKINSLLYNVWSFYRMYEKELISLSADQLISSDMNVLDKWIITRLNQVQMEVTSQLDGYNTVKAGKSIVEFVNDLSTWYLRRSRDRLKLQNEDSKKAAQVLGFVLAETSKLLAPFMPFLADFIYKDVTGKESVHLESWVNIEGMVIDEKVLSNMELVREAVTLGLALRKEKSLAVRQPLRALAFVPTQKEINLDTEFSQLILDELNVKQVDSILVDKNTRPEGVVESAGSKNIANFYLDLNLTTELKQEGLGRELERAVQDLRKKSGLKVGELVDIYYNTQDENLEDVLLKLLDRKKTFVSQISKSLEVEVDFEIQSEVDGKPIWLGMLKI